MAKEHPNKHIRKAVRYAINAGWRLKESGPRAHSWGKLLCPAKPGCFVIVYSTPRSPEHHAKAILHAVDDCPHEDEGPIDHGTED